LLAMPLDDTVSVPPMKTVLSSAITMH
jgi:hypothetical protein